VLQCVAVGVHDQVKTETLETDSAVRCSVLQCGAVSIHESHPPTCLCCSVMQCFAACCSVLQCVAVCCSVLQCVAVCCSVLQCVAVGVHESHPPHTCVMPRAPRPAKSLLQYDAVRCSVLQRVAVLQCIAVCCSVLQCVAVRCIVLQCHTHHLLPSLPTSKISSAPVVRIYGVGSASFPPLSSSTARTPAPANSRVSASSTSLQCQRLS